MVFTWRITKQEGYTLKVAYKVGDDPTEYACLLNNAKPDTKQDVLEQQIRNVVVAHYESNYRWVGTEGSFDHDPSIKRSVTVSEGKNKEKSPE